MSDNRAPSPDLAPWISRLYATVVDAPEGHRLDCGVFNETSFIRVQLAGDWVVNGRDGPFLRGRCALFLGPQSRRMPVSVTGPFISVGISLRPGACHALGGPKVRDFVDRLADLDTLGLAGEALLGALDRQSSPQEWSSTLENFVRRAVERAGGAQPDPITQRFEALTLTDPSASVSDFARATGIDLQRLERAVRRDFGMAPKQVLRRARALDMASSLRGVADQEEAEELALRYYDQSHLIRDFTDLFGMSPTQFVERPLPILTLALESRQARRLEALERLAPGQLRPWQ